MDIFETLAYVLSGWFIFLVIVQIAIIIINIVYARSKGYSGILAFLLGCFIPLLGSIIIIALLPHQGGSMNGSQTYVPQKRNVTQVSCKFCGKQIDSDYTTCPHCGKSVV
jgi:hypothetical protein